MVDGKRKEVMALTAGQLAQYRGCETWNECYSECVESAQWSLDNPDVNDNAADIAAATEWAATQKWS